MSDFAITNPSKNCAAVKRTLKLIALAALLTATAMGAAEMRTWNLKSGATMEAEIVGYPGPDTVEVKRADGKVYTLSAAYLTDGDQAYLAAERAKQWKPASVDKLLGTVGRYKKCAVSGTDVGSEVLFAALPYQVEAILNNRQQKEAEIADLNSQIQSDGTFAKGATAAAKHGSRGYRNANKTQAKLATQDANEAKASLDKLKTDYAEYVKTTKSATMVLMKNTGVMYQGLPVCECQASQKLK